MVALKSPLVDVQMDEQTALYVGVLERQVLGLTINEMKYRALLEMVTGTTWDDLKTDLEAGELEKIARAAVEAQLGVTAQEARKIVKTRQAEANS